MKRVIMPLILILAAGPALASPIGVWRVQDGSANVRIRRCGHDLCGVTGKEPVLKSMRATAQNQWTGKIWDARSGQQYDGVISLLSENALRVHGCVEGGGPCGDQTWTRVK